MEYQCECIKQQGEQSSLLLFHFEYRNIPVCFACLITGENNYRYHFALAIRSFVEAYSWTETIERKKSVQMVMDEFLMAGRTSLNRIGNDFGVKAILIIGEDVSIAGMGIATPVIYAVRSFFGKGEMEVLSDGNYSSEKGTILLLAPCRYKRQEEECMADALTAMRLQPNPDLRKILKEATARNGRQGILIFRKY